MFEMFEIPTSDMSRLYLNYYLHKKNIHTHTCLLMICITNTSNCFLNEKTLYSIAYKRIKNT